MLTTQLTSVTNMASSFACWHLSHEGCIVALVDRRLASYIGQSVLFLCLLVDDIFTLFFTDVALVIAAILSFPMGPLGGCSRL